MEAVMPSNGPMLKRDDAGRRLAFLLGLAIIILIPVSLLIGSGGVSGPGALARAIAEPASLDGIILFDIRLPRTLLAPLIGAAFGLSGAVLQGFLRNPLAEPSVLGAPQMAALGAAGAIFLGGAGATSFTLGASAIIGALVSVGLVAMIAGHGGSTATLLIAGLAISSLAGALLALVLALSDNPFALAEVVFWLIGSLEDRSWHHISIAAPPILVGMLLLVPTRPALGALVLGEETATSLGINLPLLRWRIALGVALAIGGAVAVAGAIGFVGLLAPHMVRAACRHEPGRVLLPAMLAGAVLVLIADILARVIPSPTEIKVGMITALVGVPVFLVVMVRNRARFEEGL